MPSPFFRRVAGLLEEHGFRTTRINLCAGDRLFWRGRNTIDYKGRPADWPRYIAQFFADNAVTDLVLLGEKRRYHREAVDAALSLGIRVSVTDFGYIRPDWITLERNGMSGASLFPRDPEAIRALARRAPEVDWTPRFVDSAYLMAKSDLLYNFANLLLAWQFPHYRRSDRRPPTLIYTPASAWRLLTNRLLHARISKAVARLRGGTDPYFLFPVQLDFDYQIVAYSPFEGMEQAIREVLSSFARHADPRARLVLKEHPWDPALKNWQRIMRKHAAALGIGERVSYLRGGSLDDLIRSSNGVVTVNSTSGIRALQLDRPLQVLGQAIFDVPGLTHQGGLDTFWSQASVPDMGLVEDFLKAVASTLQIRGVFFKKPGLDIAVKNAADKLRNMAGNPEAMEFE